MFVKEDERHYMDLAEGIKMKALTYGQKTLMSEFRLSEGAHLPSHSHFHEQIGYLISGRIRFEIGGKTYEAAPGDSWCIPGDVLHSADILEDSLAVEVFSPVREEYLP